MSYKDDGQATGHVTTYAGYLGGHIVILSSVGPMTGCLAIVDSQPDGCININIVFLVHHIVCVGKQPVTSGQGTIFSGCMAGHLSFRYPSVFQVLS